MIYKCFLPFYGLSFHFFFSFFNPHLRTCPLILEKRDGERERNIHVWEDHWSVAFCTRPDWGLSLQPKHVPQPGIEPTTFWLMGWCFNQLNDTSQGIFSFSWWCPLKHKSFWFWWCLVYLFFNLSHECVVSWLRNHCLIQVTKIYVCVFFLEFYIFSSYI